VTNPSFDRLDLANLGIGELDIIGDSGISQEERKARASQLKRVLAFSNTYNWGNIREYHGSFLSAVEKAGNWRVDVNELTGEFMVVAQRLQVQQVPPPQPPRRVHQPAPRFPYRVPDPAPIQQDRERIQRYFCSAFNRGTCRHGGKHHALVSGRSRVVEHFCAHCWMQFGEVSLHPEVECSRPTARKYKNQPEESAPQ